MELVPEFITHYYRLDRGPFLNLCDLDEAELDELLRDLRGAAESGTSERRFGSRYMALRRVTETRLRSRFIDRGGRPTRQSPHYFVLGESPWFRGLYRDAGEVRIRLEALESDEVSVTYPDSVTSMGLLGELGINVSPREFPGQAYRIEELRGSSDASDCLQAQGPTPTTATNSTARLSTTWKCRCGATRYWTMCCPARGPGSVMDPIEE